MAWDLDIPDFNLFLYGTADQVQSGSDIVDLASKGFVITNPYTINWKYNESLIPESDGASAYRDKKTEPHEIIMVSQLYESDAYQLFTNFATFRQEMHAVIENDYHYLLLGVRDIPGATTYYYRIYGQLLGIDIPIARKTRMHLTATIQLRFRVTDPSWYGNTVNHETVTITNGSGSKALNNVTDLDSYRVEWRVRRTTDDINSVLVTDLTDTTTISGAGTLTTTGHYFRLRTMGGESHKVEGSTITDINDKTSGQFVKISSGSKTYYFTIGSGSPDCEADIYYLTREM